jgi:hypothetical protein
LRYPGWKKFVLAFLISFGRIWPSLFYVHPCFEVRLYFTFTPVFSSLPASATPFEQNLNLVEMPGSRAPPKKKKSTSPVSRIFFFSRTLRHVLNVFQKVKASRLRQKDMVTFPKADSVEANAREESGGERPDDEASELSELVSDEDDASKVSLGSRAKSPEPFVSTRRSTRSTKGQGGVVARQEKIGKQIESTPRKRPASVDINVFDQSDEEIPPVKLFISN